MKVDPPPSHPSIIFHGRVNIIAKHSMLDVWQGFEYASDIVVICNLVKSLEKVKSSFSKTKDL